jgi:hypothetical protein
MIVYNRAQEAVSSTLNEETGEVEAPDSLNLIDQYVALLMATFIDAGLLDVSPFDANANFADIHQALVTLIGENVNALNRKATLLLGEMLQKANRILPLPYAAQMQVSLSPSNNASHLICTRHYRNCSLSLWTSKAQSNDLPPCPLCPPSEA